MNPFLFMIIFLASFIECQVFLKRVQLAAWTPSCATETTIDLNNRNISLIDSRTFSNLTQLKYLYL